MTTPRERALLLDYAQWARGDKDEPPLKWWPKLPFEEFDPFHVHLAITRSDICESLAYDGTDGP